MRGTGSSSGDATDEYPPAEQADLVEVIAWLAAQEWCNGRVGMFGTSYSGFNSLQIACEDAPALGAVFAIYSSDDRWTDDVHWRGGALKLVDLVDYCHYMTPMCVLPPVPAVWGDGWAEEWQRRLETNEPWVLRWLREDRHGDYWRGGSVRLGADGAGYERLTVPTMLVAGWADGYRNNSFRTVAALAANGVPHRLLAGPWAHADPRTAMPGPRIDLDVEMAAWFDRWLRDPAGDAATTRTATSSSAPPPGPSPTSTCTRAGGCGCPPCHPPGPSRSRSPDRARCPWSPTPAPPRGSTAPGTCRGASPGTSASTTPAPSCGTSTPPDLPVVGHPRVRLRVSADAPAASLSVKLCDVFPDGTSALVSRGTLDLALRDGVHGAPVALEPGREYDVVLDLDACAYSWDPATGCGSAWRGRTGPTPSRRRRRSSSPSTPASWSCPPWSATSPSRLHRRRGAQLGVRRRHDVGDP